MLAISNTYFMSLPPGIDPDLLRAFVLIADGYSFTAAAAIVGRTQSAVSMQVKRLEDLLGQPVLVRNAQGAELTPHGQYLLSRARQILALQDEVIAAFHAPTVAGAVRLGTPDDYAFQYLPPILRRLAETHPAVQVDVLCLPSSDLVSALRADELDLALVSAMHDTRGLAATPLWRGPLAWVTSEQHAPHRQRPLPLALAAIDCQWKNQATRALDRGGIPYRIAYTSSTQVGTQAPVLAGLAVTVSPLSWLPAGLRALRADEGLPPLPQFGIEMVRARNARQPVTDALAALIEDGFLRGHAGGPPDASRRVAAE